MLNLVSLTFRYITTDIGQNSDGAIFDFRIFGQSLIKENCHNSRTSDDIGMKLRPVTKRTKRNKTTSKKMAGMCEVIVIFPFYGQFEKIREPDSGHIVCETFSLIVTFYLTKTENRTKKSLTQLSCFCYE